MKKLILASISAIALFGVAACNDTDKSKTTSAKPPATDNSATQGSKTTPDTGTGGTTTEPMKSAPEKPAAPAQ